MKQYTADPTTPPLIANAYHSLLPQNATQLEHLAGSITEKLETIPVPFEVLWDLGRAPDTLLDALAYAVSIDEFNDAWSPITKRQLIQESHDIHRKKGTKWAVKRVLSVMNYDATLIEWFEKTPKGSAGTFSIAIRPKDGLLLDNLDQLKAAIDGAKRLSAHYEVYVGYEVSTTPHVHTAAAVGVMVTVHT